MSDIALYRKYRPTKFSEVINQEHIKQTLANALVLDKVNHAYLFSGPRGVGKTTIGRLLAKAVNCKYIKKNKGEPCNKCDSCKEILSDKSVDLVEIDAASNRGIDEIRELREKIKYKPTNLKYRVFIIDEVHMLTIEAFNALLKTLEEPPSHVIFIMATTEPQKIPATILSRCQRFDFKKISVIDLSKHIKKLAKKENINIDDNAVELISENADGSSRDSLSILSQVIAAYGKKRIKNDDIRDLLGLANNTQIYKYIELTFAKNINNALIHINELISSGYAPSILLDNIIEILRKLLIKANINNQNCDADEDFAKLSENNLNTKNIIELIKKLVEAKNIQNSVSIPQLPLELATISFIYQNDGMIIDDNINSVEETPANNNVKNINNSPDDDFKKIHKKKFKKCKIKSGEMSVIKKKIDENVKISIDEINDKWHEFMKAIEEKNYSLGMFMRPMQPQKTNNNFLTLACKYEFHRDCLNKTDNKAAIEKILFDIYKKPLAVECVIDESIKNNDDENISASEDDEEINKDNKNADLLGSAIDIFGGKINN